MDDRRETLRGRLMGLGFDAVRFAAVEPHAVARGLPEWLAAGHHADMDWMERTAAKRVDPELVLGGVRSAVLLGINYLGPSPASGGGPAWARYSLHADYHDSVKPALAAAGRLLEETCGAAAGDYRYYVDTGPVLERAWAARAGVGFVGKNAMLISRTHGNWLFLATILTRVPFEPDPPVSRRAEPGAVGALCGRCTRCMDACPTQAFAGPGVLDARRCVSYQTIENKGVIPAALRPGIGNRIYGCDTCLEVCPWNRFAHEGRRMLLASRADLAALTLREILALTPERFASVFRGTAVKRLKLRGLLRNACVVAGNSADASLLGDLLPLASHPEPVVRAHAVWAVGRLGGASLLSLARESETDADVLAEYASISAP